MALQLFFFLNVSPCQICSHFGSLVKNFLTKKKNREEKLARSIVKKPPNLVGKLKKKVERLLTKL